MAVLPIRKFGDEILRQPAEAVTQFDSALHIANGFLPARLPSIKVTRQEI